MRGQMTSWILLARFTHGHMISRFPRSKIDKYEMFCGKLLGQRIVQESAAATQPTQAQKNWKNRISRTRAPSQAHSNPNVSSADLLFFFSHTTIWFGLNPRSLKSKLIMPNPATRACPAATALEAAAHASDSWVLTVIEFPRMGSSSPAYCSRAL